MPARTKTNLIVIHCAATKPGMDIGAKEIRRWHKERGWSDIGYHYVVRRDGRVEAGRPLDQVGAHVAGYNAHSIGICLVGGINEEGQPENNFTPAQFTALRGLVASMLVRFPGCAVRGHRDLDPGKACPSFDVAAWMEAQFG